MATTMRAFAGSRLWAKKEYAKRARWSRDVGKHEGARAFVQLQFTHSARSAFDRYSSPINR